MADKLNYFDCFSSFYFVLFKIYLTFVAIRLPFFGGSVPGNKKRQGTSVTMSVLGSFLL